MRQTSADLLSKLADKLGGTLRDGPKSTVITVTPDKAPEACIAVSSLSGLYHLSTITGIDLGDEIEILYHFWEGKRFVIVRTDVPKSVPRIRSVADAMPSATLYEAEVQDLLGVAFDGNPYTGRRLLLPDDYPAEAPPPLRKDADPEKIRKMMKLE
ncbi:MAG: NADH-quinone oxidoreductase subunit C [Nitrososphaerota archaeon]|nr:NADH-quinone oxidoreductase subunit C [Nitrososphaerota archaeon]